jgi:hypothetical protein
MTPATDPSPARLLFGWGHILNALGQPNSRPAKRRVRTLNVLYEGPIILPGPHHQPVADKDKLLGWWNGLEERFRELEQRRADREATLAARHPYGRNGTVLPDISGHVKHRRAAQS